MRRYALLLILPLVFAAFVQAEESKSLFSKDNLDGWTAIGPGKWRIEDGVITGSSPASEATHSILLSDKRYGDFEVELKFKAVKGNSGFYFRVDKVDSAVSVHGFQAEVDPAKDTGGLYETGGRAWVVQPTQEQVDKWLKKQEWNTMRIVAKGKDVTVYLNGHKTAELKNDPGRTSGHFGLQLHGGQDMLVHFKDVKVKELGESE